ncbi:MAG: hypothetical protein HY791_09845 [Deltaproteobacteria bacterium]|nr:hypothetical protein [Deltaproteobacteria bacterium]
MSIHLPRPGRVASNRYILGLLTALAACSDRAIARVDLPASIDGKALILVASGRDLPSPKLFGVDPSTGEGAPTEPILEGDAIPAETISFHALLYSETLPTLQVPAGPLELTAEGHRLPVPATVLERRVQGTDVSRWSAASLPEDIARLQIRTSADLRCAEVVADTPIELPRPEGTYQGASYPVFALAAFVLAIDESTVWVGTRLRIDLGGAAGSAYAGTVHRVTRGATECCEEVTSLRVPFGGSPFIAATRVGDRIWLGRYDGTIVELDDRFVPTSTVALIGETSDEQPIYLRKLVESDGVVFALTQTREMFAIERGIVTKLGEWSTPDRMTSNFDRNDLAALPGAEAAAVVNDVPLFGILSRRELETQPSPRASEGLASVLVVPSLGIVVGGSGFVGILSNGTWRDLPASAQVSVDVLLPYSDGFIWAGNAGFFGHFSAEKLDTDGNGFCPAQQLSNGLAAKLGLALEKGYVTVADSRYPVDRGLMLTFFDVRSAH